RHTRFSRDWSSDVCSSDLSPDRLAVHGVHPGADRGILVVPKITGRRGRLAGTGYWPELPLRAFYAVCQRVFHPGKHASAHRSLAAQPDFRLNRLLSIPDCSKVIAACFYKGLTQAPARLEPDFIFF